MVLRNTILFTISNGAIRLANILFLPWISAKFNFDQIGLYFIILVLADILFSVSSLGTNASLGRFLPDSFKKGE